MSYSSKRYIWRHGTQCHGVDGCPDESCSHRVSGESFTCLGAASRVAAWKLPVGCRPYADSRARLTEGRRMHNSRHGGVSSSRASTAPGMVL
jgi:hypothetical protein